MATFTEEFTRMRQDFDQAQADRHQLFDDTQEYVKNMKGKNLPGDQALKFCLDYMKAH